MIIDPSSAEPETAIAPLAQRTARHLLALDAMVEISLDLMRLVQVQAHVEVETATRRDQPAPDFTHALERVSRTIRRTILLAQKIAEPVKAPAAARPVPDRVAARRQIIRKIEDAIDRDAPAEKVESLQAEFLERLDSPDVADDIGQRPIEDIITDIRRDLGIAALPGAGAWKRRTPRDVALLCARAAGNTASFGQAEAEPRWDGDPPIRDP